MASPARFLPVARREYIERVRTKAFVIGTVLAPLLMTGMMLGPAFLSQRQRGNPLRISVVDATGGTLRAEVEQALAARKEAGQTRFLIEPAPEASPEELKARLSRSVVEGRIDGYLLLPEATLAKSAAEYYGKSVSNRMDMRLLERVVQEVVVGRRLAGEGLDPKRVRDLTRPVSVRTIRVSERGEREDRGVTFLFGLFMMMLLYISVLMWGQALMTGVIEEKSNRVVELTVSAMSAWHLFLGKLMGVGGAGLTQLGAWVGSAALVSFLGAPMLASSEIPMPEVTWLILLSFPVYFLLGYFLYASLYAAIGAAVNTIQEAQNLVFPVVMPLVTSVMFFPVVLQTPDSPLAVGASLFPFFTPLLMFLRITVLTPPAWQIALSVALTVATVGLVIWASARIYRVGILMYGKRPTFPELLRWVRHS
jgi:ABC-2 type transport system permease protein